MYDRMKCAGKEIHRELLLQGANSYTLRRFREECHILSGLQHPNIVQFFGVFFKVNERVPILVMEFVPMNLTSIIESRGILPDQTSYSILRDVSMGLCYLHGHNPPVIHRDLSSNNVLLTEDMIAKISDFGVSRIIDLSPYHASLSTGIPGTPTFMPPEVFEAHPRYDTSMDVFSFGVMMIHMFCGRWPEPQCGPTRTEGDKVIGVSESERRDTFLQAIGCYHPLMKLIQRCIHNDPSRRPLVDAIINEVKTLSGERQMEKRRCEVPDSTSTEQSFSEGSTFNMSMEAGIQKSSPNTMQALGESSEFPDVRNYIGGLKLTDEINRSTGLQGSTSLSLDIDNTFLLSSSKKQQPQHHSFQHQSGMIPGAPVFESESDDESEEYKQLVESLVLHSKGQQRRSASLMLPLSPFNERQSSESLVSEWHAIPLSPNPVGPGVPESVGPPGPTASIWVPLSLPSRHNLKSICLSDNLLWAVDSESNVFCTVMGGQKPAWKKVKGHCMDQVSCSSSGHNVWGVYNCDAYVRFGIGLSREGNSWKNVTTKTNLAHKIKQIAVDETAVWAVTTSGKILFRCEVGVAFPKGRVWQEVGHYSSQFAFIACCKDVVWAISTVGKVYCRTGISLVKPSGSEWKEVYVPSLVCLSITSGCAVWGVSQTNSIIFRRGVSTSTPDGMGPWWEVSIDALTQSDSPPDPVSDGISPLDIFKEPISFIHMLFSSSPSSVGHHRPADMSGSSLDLFKEPESFVNDLLGLDSTLIISASSKSGVVVLENKRHLHTCLTTVTGYHYTPAYSSDQFESMHWSMIAASATTLWLVSSDRERLYCLSSDNKLSRIDCPVKVIDLIAASPTCVWIASEGSIFSSSTKVPECLTFDRIDLTVQLPTVELCHITCGEKTAWAVGTNGIPYFRYQGVCARDCVTGISPTWTPVGDYSRPLQIQSAAVSPDDCLVWARDEDHKVYARTGITDHVPSGQKWELVPDVKAKELCATNENAFALSTRGEVYCRYGIDKLKSNAEGDHWRKMPGKYEHIAVGEGDLWVLDEKGRVWKQQWVVMNVGSRPPVAKHRTGLVKSSSQASSVSSEWDVII